MMQVSVAWRDIQKLMDDFNDERVDAKRSAKGNYEEYSRQWNNHEQQQVSKLTLISDFVEDALFNVFEMLHK